MMPDNIDQNLRRGADSLPLFHCFIDQRLSFYVQLLRLFDDRLCPIEKIDQRLARRQRFLNLPKLCIAETGNVTNEVNEPVLQHGLPCYCIGFTADDTNGPRWLLLAHHIISLRIWSLPGHSGHWPSAPAPINLDL